MNIELKPIAESKVRQLGGDVCGVLVRTQDGVMAVSEHGRCTRLDAGVMGPVDRAQGVEVEQIGFPVALKRAKMVFQSYREDFPKWGKRLDGTPAQNDLPVRLAQAFSDLYQQPPAPSESGVPKGWKLVPVNPTGEMLGKMKHWADGYHNGTLIDRYTEMLDAAPELPGHSAGSEQVGRAQGGQGAEVVAWCWENHGRHVTVDKSFAKELIADGEIVRPLVYGDTQPQPAVPEAKEIIDRVVAELQTGFVRCERCGDQEDTATLDCMTDLKRLKALLSTPTTPQADGCPECGSTDLTWHTQSSVTTGTPDGKLRANEVSTLFVLGCNHCSETIKTLTADQVAENMSPLPPAGQEGAQ